jgi:DNA-binding NarL/FixJ family response regulator
MPMSRPRILCIEDDPGAAELIVEVLEDEGFAVSVAADGLAALEQIGQRPDLILCDIDLPDLSGMEVLARVRSGKLLPVSVPFIFLTAFAQRAYQVQARQLGCDDYVTKPIDFEMLVAIIRHRLAGSADRASDRMAYRLTDREVEALTWAARGKSSYDIATILGISERTVNFHMDNAMRKLGVATRIQAAVKCAMLGIITP